MRCRDAWEGVGREMQGMLFLLHAKERAVWNESATAISSMQAWK